MFNCYTKTVFFLFLCFLTSCVSESTEQQSDKKTLNSKQYLVVLGIAQDAGFPQIDNAKEWEDVYKERRSKELVSCLGLVDTEDEKKWIFDATPDISEQLFILENKFLKTKTLVDGVFLTHAHIGHYTGLMYFGREAMGAKNIPVYAMPKMRSFLANNGPWSQLISLNNIKLTPLDQDSIVKLNSSLNVTPFLVPHRDEFSETIGFKISGKNKTALFIPDINKWKLWKKDIVEEVKKVDYALLDATFFADGEISRPMDEVPHPFILETTALFKDQSREVKNKIIFIHFNHSNPGLKESYIERRELEKEGFRFAKTGMSLPL